MRISDAVWVGWAIGSAIRAWKAPNETVKAIYVLCIIISLAILYLLWEIREIREK